MAIITLFIFLLLLLATFVIKYQLVTSSSQEAINNRLRIHTWWYIFVICMPVLYLGGWAITFLVYGLVYWSAFEFSRLLKLRINKLSIILCTIVLISYHAFTLVFNESLAIYFILPFVVLLVLLAASSAINLVTAVRATLVLAFCITSIFSIELISLISKSLSLEAGLVILFLFFVTASNDIFQYICGKLFGRLQLAPVISKNKTYEGAIGGIVLTAFLSMMTAPYVLEVSSLVAITIGVLIAILGILGDLSVSYLKRMANVKDTGASLPGHGGLLDRIDSLLLSAPGFGLCLSLIFT